MSSGFDELTHFTESQFTYLLSRIRGTNGFPKQVKATTNPGGVGHQWVKSRFIDSMPPDTVREFDGGTRLFLPARLGDNPFLRKADAGYEERLKLPLSCRPESTARRRVGTERGTVFQRILTRPACCKAVCHPARLAALPDHRLRSGHAGSALDRAKSGRTQRGLPRTLPSGTHHFGCSGADACLMRRRENTSTPVSRRPDLWNRRQETGRSAVELFADSGLDFVKSSNERVAGWLALHELLQPRKDTDGAVRPRLTIFDTCHNLIRTLPALQHDKRNPSDTANTPHELTHAPDALRGYAATVYEPVKAVPQSAYDYEVGEFLRF